MKTKTPLALAKQVLDIELAGLKAVRAQLDAQFTLAVETLAEALSHRNKLVVVGIGNAQRKPVGLIDSQDLPKLKLA